MALNESKSSSSASSVRVTHRTSAVSQLICVGSGKRSGTSTTIVQYDQPPWSSLVDVGDGMTVEVVTDLLDELSQGRLERRLALVEGAARDGPSSTAMGVQRTLGDEVPVVVAVDMANEHAGRAEPAPPGIAIARHDEPVT